MTGLIGLIIIITLWIFVLAPWILRGQKPIKKAGKAFNDMRVIHHGGTNSIPARRRRPIPSPIGENIPTDESVEKPAIEANLEDTPLLETPTIETPTAPDDNNQPYAFDTAYIDPEDLLYPEDDTTDNSSATDNAADTDTDAADTEIENSLTEHPDADTSPDELNPDEIAFAESRRGRGGYDPIADKAVALTRYQRRQRTVLGLFLALTISVLVAFVMGGGYWGIPAAIGGLTVWYLAALRSQVKAEANLRRRRIQQLRRSRLGVRNTVDAELNIPPRLRRPGAVVLEIDDSSPDFFDLETIYVEKHMTPNVSQQSADLRVS